MPFQKGNKLATGGARPGAGRKNGQFQSQLGAGLADGKILQTVIDMAQGINGEWSEKIRFSAATWLLEMYNGKASQTIEADIEIRGRFVLVCPDVIDQEPVNMLEPQIQG